MANALSNLRDGKIDDLLTLPSGKFYIACRVEGSIGGYSAWSKPIEINWTNTILDFPAEYWQKQEEAFDQIKAVCLECQAANMPVSQELIDMYYLIIKTSKLLESPVAQSNIRFRITANGVLAENSSLGVDGKAYGDTFIAPVNFPSRHDGRKVGCLQADTGTTPFYYDLDKSHGKFVMDYSNGDQQFYIAYEGETIKKNGVFYCIKKESTIRRNVTIDLSY